MSGEVAYLRARFDEEEALARGAAGYESRVYWDHALAARHLRAPSVEHYDTWTPGRVMAEIKAKRAILDFHDAWPVLTTSEPKPELRGPAEITPDSLGRLSFHVRETIDWLTTRQYIERFGVEPPTSAVIRAMLQVYADRDDFHPEWRD